MYSTSKPVIKCPLCGKDAKMCMNTHYVCECGWNSLEDTIDIGYKDTTSSALSNLFPHKFLFYTCEEDKTHCLSMESFLQSLRVQDPKHQKYICENYSGYLAWKLKFSLHDWREDGLLYWNGKAIVRDSEEYTSLITTAYDRLFEDNFIFRDLVLPKFKGKILIHSMGCDDKHETILTEEEYRFQLNRLMAKLP